MRAALLLALAVWTPQEVGADGARQEAPAQEHGQREADGTPEPAPVLAPRTEIAGLRAVMSVSTLIYPGHEDRPHELVAKYTFPDRAKWHRSLVGGSHRDRQIEYRSGDACWRLDPGQTTSVRLDAPARDELTLRMELRRALLLWPDGFGWEPAPEDGAEGAGSARRAALGTLGHLEAELGPDGRPARMRSFGPAGEPREAYAGIVWSPAPEAGRAGRALPTALELEVGGRTVWRETIGEVALRAEFLDLQFVPPDRSAFRPELPTERRTGLPRHEHALPARCVRRVALEPGLDLRAALARAAEVWSAARAAPPAGRGLAESVELELDGNGRPRAVLLALVEREPDEPAPPGWTRAPAQEARAAYLDALPPEAAEEHLRAVLEELEAALPAGREAGPARLGFDPRGQPGARRLRVLLPLVP